jgi:hypothetical protein
MRVPAASFPVTFNPISPMSLFDSMTVQRLLMTLPLILPLAACAQQEGEAAPGSEEMAAADAPQVEVVAKEAENKVDVLVDGQLFTSYLFPSTIQKPVLYPIRSATGQAITRGFPLDPTPGERVDHPHHVGLWFNYGDVNGLDFWNNSDAIPENRKARMGTIVHRQIRNTESGAGKGALDVTMEWVNHAGDALLREDTRFEFGAEGNARTIDRITQLTALEDTVTFTDNKEGVLGLRVTRALEHPATKPEVFTDASGKPTEVAVLNNEGVTGKYLTSEGAEGEAVWGTRGKWNSLSGIVDGAPVTVAIFDHPSNTGYPTYWHSRGYGLFAANPLAPAAMSEGKDQPMVIKLAPGESVTFRHRIAVIADQATPEQLEQRYQAFAQ